MASEVTLWNKVMSSALAIPGVQVDRENFLRSELRQYCSKDELEKAICNPVDVLSEDRIDSLANSCINNAFIKSYIIVCCCRYSWRFGDCCNYTS